MACWLQKPERGKPLRMAKWTNAECLFASRDSVIQQDPFASRVMAQASMLNA